MRSRLLVVAAVMALSGCTEAPPLSQAETPAPSISRAAPTAHAPTPAPASTPSVTEEQLAAACSGRAIPSAAPYAGKVHPLVVIDAWLGDDVDTVYGINKKLAGGVWASPSIQLVVCVPYDQNTSVKVGSCGRHWKRQSDGVVGELVKQRYKMKIRVVVARTGKTLQTKTLYGSTPTCGGKFSSLDLSVKPPWKGYGSEITVAQINKYATAVSKQAVKR